MQIPKFEEKELKVVREIPGLLSMPATEIFDFPIQPKEAYRKMMERKPVWQVSNVEINMFNPRIYPDNVARATINEAAVMPKENFGGNDMFGIEWTYIDTVGGSMVRPGKPFLSNANEWKEKIVWPDIDSWDWEGSSKENKDYYNGGAVFSCILNGYFERLISLMDFMNAAVALIDEDQQDAIKEFFEKLTDLYIKVVDKFAQYYPVNIINLHDDWGSQHAPFFSMATVREMIVPYMKRLTDHIHSKGIYADLHSCGHIEMLVPAIIEAGWDSWSPQPMNDTKKIYEEYARNNSVPHHD
jgi:hypothetical protein